MIQAGFSILAAHRLVDFVGSDDTEVGILNFPPPLMDDEADFQAILRHGLVLDFHGRAGGHQHKNENDEAENNRPGYLDFIATINLRRLLEMIRRSTRAEFDEDAGHHSDDYNKNAKAYEMRWLKEQFGRTGERLENVRDSMNFSNRCGLWFGCERGCAWCEEQKSRCRSGDERF